MKKIYHNKSTHVYGTIFLSIMGIIGSFLFIFSFFSKNEFIPQLLIIPVITIIYIYTNFFLIFIEFDESSVSRRFGKNGGYSINYENIYAISTHIRPFQSYIITTYTGWYIFNFNRYDYLYLCVLVHAKNPKCRFEKRTKREIKKLYNIDITSEDLPFRLF